MSFNDQAGSLVKNLSNSIISLIKIVITSKFSSIKKADSNSTILVIANGPSLNEELRSIEILNKVKNIDTLCVNYFYKSEFFIKLKPKYYIIAAPELWLNDVDEVFAKNRIELFTKIADQVSWKMDFFAPFEAKKFKFWQDILKKNKNIRIQFYNLTALEGFESFLFYMYNKQLGMPRSHNIVGYTLMLLIWKGYKKIGIIGVEHSWTKEIFVTENNEALLAQPHFYNTNAKPEVMAKKGKDSRKLHEILGKFYLTFKSYFEIEAYAKKHSSQIYNLTKGSFIDAFKRDNIKNFLNN